MTTVAGNSDLVDVAALEDLEEARPFSVNVRGREIIVVRWNGSFFAVRNICAHQSAMLSYGWVQSQLVQGESFYDVDILEDTPVVRCPWHAFRFRLEDGRCVADPKLRIRSYRVVVQKDRVFVDLGGP
jgi:nitrite reductase/ring-hydroxylating ferredoxin subunit